MNNTYVLATVEAMVRQKGQIIARLLDVEVMNGERPKDPVDFGGNPKEIEKLNRRIIGDKIKTRVYLASGIVPIINPLHLRWCENEKVTKRVEGNVGNWNNLIGLIGPRRDEHAGGTWLKADNCAGVSRSIDFIKEALIELAELEFYNEDGWAAYTMSEKLDAHHECVFHILNTEQDKFWSMAEPDKKVKHLISTRFISQQEMQQDIINGINCIISAESNVCSLERMIPMKINLPNIEGGLLVRDGEIAGKEGNEFLLNRGIVMIFRREDKPPIMFGIGDKGLDLRFPFVSLDEENIRINLNPKTESSLKALKWI